MNRTTLHIVVGLFLLGFWASAAPADNWTAGMSEGKPAFKSMGPITFGPDGILFVADTRDAAIVAIATGDTTPTAAKALKVEQINQKIAALLGTTADQILIDDLAVNPISHAAYLAVSRGRGPKAVPVLLRVKNGDQIEMVSLEKIKFSKVQLPDPPAEAQAEGNRGPNPRLESITDLAFLEDQLLVAGLSNEEFSSTLRTISFPFRNAANGTGVEIYHGSHGRFETRAPVRTLVPMMVGHEPQILAAYTCTPLVQFPVNELKPGAKIKGKTIAELGNRNRPIDMIVYQQAGKDYLLLANSTRGVMKISLEGMDKAESIVGPVQGTKGLASQTVAGWTGVEQLDRFDDGNAAVLRKDASGAYTLESLPLP